MTNPTFPWKMDRELDGLTKEILAFPREMNPIHYDDVNYLLHRLKLAEGERDRWMKAAWSKMD